MLRWWTPEREGLHRPEHRVPALGLGETAPDAVRLLDLDRVLATFRSDGTNLGVLATFRSDGTNLADGLGPDLPTFAFVFSFLGTGREKEVRMVAATQCDRLPRSITRHHRSSTVLLD
jgi:hypothetical protein